MGRFSFWMVVFVLTLGWLVSTVDFYLGMPQSEGYFWRDLSRFPIAYLVLREMSDHAVARPLISVPLITLLYGMNIRLLVSAWPKQPTVWHTIRNRLYAAVPSLLAPGIYLIVVVQAARSAYSNMGC